VANNDDYVVVLSVDDMQYFLAEHDKVGFLERPKRRVIRQYARSRSVCSEQSREHVPFRQVVLYYFEHASLHHHSIAGRN
jgi:hypothetical protein